MGGKTQGRSRNSSISSYFLKNWTKHKYRAENPHKNRRNESVNAPWPWLSRRFRTVRTLKLPMKPYKPFCFHKMTNPEEGEEGCDCVGVTVWERAWKMLLIRTIKLFWVKSKVFFCLEWKWPEAPSHLNQVTGNWQIKMFICIKLLKFWTRKKLIGSFANFWIMSYYCWCWSFWLMPKVFPFVKVYYQKFFLFV